jgi:hypothetical protein
MKLFKTNYFSACSFIFIFTFIFFFFHNFSYAETRPMQPSSQRQIPHAKEPVTVVPTLKLCADLKANLSITKNNSGLVTLSGTITNIGNKDYDIPSKAQYFMNLSYPPKTYAQVGVSEQLLDKEFTQLKKGASFPVNLTYQIPNFEAWVQGSMAPQAKRLFTLRVTKKDMSPFNTGEECNPGNNSAVIEVGYLEKPK